MNRCRYFLPRSSRFCPFMPLFETREIFHEIELRKSNFYYISGNGRTTVQHNFKRSYELHKCSSDCLFQCSTNLPLNFKWQSTCVFDGLVRWGNFPLFYCFCYFFIQSRKYSIDSCFDQLNTVWMRGKYWET